MRVTVRSGKALLKTSRALVYAVVVAIASMACSAQKFAMEPVSADFGQKVEYNKQVDILVVLDTSGSMLKRQEKLAAQAESFIHTLNQTGLDYQIAATTMDMGAGAAKGSFLRTPDGTPAVLSAATPNLVAVLQERIRAGQNGATVERGLQAVKAALTPPNSTTFNSGFLRTNALFVVIFLTDEEDQSPVEDYAAFLNQLKPPLPSGERSWIANFIGVIPEDPSCKAAEWGDSHPGFRYMEVVAASGGRNESICHADLSYAVDSIKARIIEIVTEYSLGPRKANKETIKVYVNGTLLPESSDNGWTYNADRNSITFHGGGVPAPGSTIHVDFDPEGIK